MIRPRSRCAPAARRLNLESLEDRRLLAASLIDLPTVSTSPGQYASDHILVRFNEGATPVALPGTTLGALISPVPNLYNIKLSANVTVNQALAEYRLDARVSYAETDLQLTPTWTPNDPLFNQQWDMQNTGQGGGTRGADIKATAAWGIICTARQIPIAVFDTGVDYTHPDLYDNIWINQKEIPASRLKNLRDYFNDGYISMRDLNDPRNQGLGKITDLNHNGYIDGGDLIAPMIKNPDGSDSGKGGWADGISEDGSGYVDDLIGWNSNANNNNPMDGYGHGTHVAGTIGAMGNDGIGVAGINWGAQIVPVKFFDDSGHGTISQFITGLNWALAHGIKISNNSWNDGGYTPALYDAVALAQSKGHLFIAAAGNNGRNTDNQPAYPADFPLDNVVSVAATDLNDNLAGFSNYGKNSVDIAAPGVSILSTLPHNQYGLESGTSMATPHVTGIAALVWSLRPEWTYKQVVNQLLATADRLPSLTGKVESGELDALAAVRVPPRAYVTSAAGVVLPPPGSASTKSAPALMAVGVDPAGPTEVSALLVPKPGAAVPSASYTAAVADVRRDNSLSLGYPADLLGYRLAQPPQGVDAPAGKAKGNGSSDDEGK